MSKHQIPQDVEVADKILGPLTLKQFIFAIIFFASAYLDYLLFKAFPLLVIVGLPFTIFFGVLAFYQREDQPVEVYLMSALRFYTAPRNKVWDAEGYNEMVEITAPKNIDIQRTKDLSANEISSNLNSLSKIMDTHGWASRNMDSLGDMGVADNDRLMSINEIQTIPGSTGEDNYFIDQKHDILDGNATTVARKFNNLVEQRALQIRQQALAQMQQNNTSGLQSTPANTPDNTSPTSLAPVPAQISQLASNNDLSISALSKEAQDQAPGAELKIH